MKQQKQKYYYLAALLGVACIGIGLGGATSLSFLPDKVQQPQVTSL